MPLRNNSKIHKYKDLILYRDTWRQIFYYSSGDDLKRLTISCKAFKKIIDSDFSLSSKRWGEGSLNEHLVHSLINPTGPVHVGSDARTMIRSVLYVSLNLNGKILIILPIEHYDETLESIKNVNGMGEILLMPHKKKNPDCYDKAKKLICSSMSYKIVLGNRHSKRLSDIFKFSPPNIIFAMNAKCMSQVLFKGENKASIFFTSLSPRDIAFGSYLRDRILNTEKNYINKDCAMIQKTFSSNNNSTTGCGRDNKIYIKALLGVYKCEVYLMKENNIPSLIDIGKENVIVFRSSKIPRIDYPFKEWKEIDYERQDLKNIIDSARKIVIFWTPEINNLFFYKNLPLFQNKKCVFILKDSLETILGLRYRLLDEEVLEYINLIIPNIKFKMQMSKDRLKFLRKNRKRCFNDFEFIFLIRDPSDTQGSLEWINKFNLFIDCEW